MRTPLAKRREAETPAAPETHMIALIEALFFAYRDFVGDADRLLDTYRFGRAHHRALHFIARRPGLTIAELLEILRITKQSLNRVLRDLIEGGFIEPRAGDIDRRQRRLFVTTEGASLAADLVKVQSERLRRAVRSMGAGGEDAAAAFLRGVSQGGGPT